jgi:uncharacterized protein (DUF2126 family)
LIELRAFETMPEIDQQSLAALFVRAVLAMLATKPCTEPLIRLPLLEQRFPELGRFELDGAGLLVRQALEPWPLMAEIADGGTTSPVVDNSTDRIEISMSNPAALGASRVVVNGVALPMREVDGTLVTGVRYKSASGWPALHPYIPVQSPLQIEVVDGASLRDGGHRTSAWARRRSPKSPRTLPRTTIRSTFAGSRLADERAR